MAYNVADRFPKLPKYYPLLDPGTYETMVKTQNKENVAPFLSRSPRLTGLPAKIWTHCIYSADYPHRIPNCSTMMSRLPRFSYEILQRKLSDELICECDTQQKCECIPEDKKKNEKNEPIKHPRIMIGPPPRANINRGLTVRCPRHDEYKLFGNRTEQNIQNIKENTDEFRNIRIRQLIAFYKGSKCSKGIVKTVHEYPGPATYNLTQKPTQAYICAERVRAYRRKTSKQYRFIELVQQKNIRENLPGPASYNPQLPKRAELQFYGPRAERFGYSNCKDKLAPCTYNIKRDFDLLESLQDRCHATLPVRSAFGSKASRFKLVRHEGPGPGNYNPSYKRCMVTHCSTAPFGSTSLRFADVDEVEDETFDKDLCLQTNNKDEIECEKSNKSWMFKSHTIRMSPLKKKNNEPSPADMSPKKIERKRSQELQNAAPFGTSKGRFEPWYNWISVHNAEDRPGPGKYKTEKMSCMPAVVRGPLFRCERFKSLIPQAPPPNTYKVSRGLEAILHTHNKKLNGNITKKHEFHWKGFRSKKTLSDKERESHLINCCLSILNTDIFSAKNSSTEKENIYPKIKKGKKNKMLRCFLYKNFIPHYY